MNAKLIGKIVGLLVLVTLLAGGSLAGAAEFEWKLQSSHPAGAPQIVLLNRMADDIEKMSAGRMKIEILASGAIVKPFEVLEAVNKGIIECRTVLDPLLDGETPGRQSLQFSARRLRKRSGPDQPSFLVPAGGRTGPLPGILPEDPRYGRHALHDRAGRT